ncbi:uncharacterized protein [Typha angustifolia]|uniref:uncharacterized protein n=1 Tax=Typha angustifolia TaxID=59011 RepID=UPI003C2ECB9F
MARPGLILFLLSALILVAVAMAANANPKPEKPKPGKPPKTVKCKESKKLYPYCFNKHMYCPTRCPYSCYVDCDSCKPVCVCSVPGACGDPRFIGGDGNAFYFHGHKDKDFCIVSDSNLHINAHFIGKRSPTMTRDFTWIQAVAIIFGEHRLYVGAEKTAIWDDDVDRLKITFDGETVNLEEGNDAEWTSTSVPALSIARTKAANGVILKLEGRFKIIANAVPITEEESRVHNYGMTSDDCLAHLDLAFRFNSLTSDVHGVIGQTYRPDYVNKFDVTAKMPVMGGETNFSSSDLFATDCAVARFGRDATGIDLVTEHADVTCSSGLDGPGVVCKK